MLKECVQYILSSSPDRIQYHLCGSSGQFQTRARMANDFGEDEEVSGCLECCSYVRCRAQLVGEANDSLFALADFSIKSRMTFQVSDRANTTDLVDLRTYHYTSFIFVLSYLCLHFSLRFSRRFRSDCSACARNPILQSTKPIRHAEVVAAHTKYIRKREISRRFRSIRKNNIFVWYPFTI